MTSNIAVRAISPEETLTVRHSVLRKGKPLETAYFEGDKHPSTVHLGLFYDQCLIGVVTFMESSRTAETSAWQLRGMAVLEEFQGNGLGVFLVNEGEQIARTKGIKNIWCNARIKAKSFYEKLGFSTIGKPFEIGDIGLHYVMEKKL
jgi:GNAT superfamily N-acetyltransferase